MEEHPKKKRLPRSLIPDPSTTFESPEQVRDHPDLTIAQKIKILRGWAYDDAEMSVALEEGMPEAPNDDIGRRVLMVLQELMGEIDFEHTAPNKQHGIPSGSGKT